MIALKNRYLFILSPPYCGSTLFTKLISTSPHVSCNNYEGEMEGQKLDKAFKLINKKDRWNPDYDYDWETLKRIWMEEWDTSKYYLLEKSPPNIVRTVAIERHFSPVDFIILIRNPLSICESLHHRNNMPYEEAALQVQEYFEYQYHNKLRYENALVVHYEKLCDDPEGMVGKILYKLPLLESLEVDAKYDFHNRFSNGPIPITNNTMDKLNKISYDDKMRVRDVLEKQIQLFEMFGYDLQKWGLN